MAVGVLVGVGWEDLHLGGGVDLVCCHGGGCHIAGDVGTVGGGVAGEGAEIDAREFE